MNELTTWQRQLREDSKETVAGERSGYPWIQVKLSKEFYLAGAKIASPLNVIALSSAFDYGWYANPFDGMDSHASPDCFAIGRELPLRPHASAPNPQSDLCTSCPHDKFETAENGRGKACRQRVRLALMTADDADQIAFLRMPPTSIGNWAAFVRQMKAQGLPPYAAVCAIGFNATASYPKLTFTISRLLETEADVVRVRAARALVQPPQSKPNGNEDDQGGAPAQAEREISF